MKRRLIVRRSDGIKQRYWLSCNKPIKSWKKGKKLVVNACQDDKQKIIHFGAEGYGSNYSDKARDSFRARHSCAKEKNKLTARYWACEALWTKKSPVYKCPKTRRCKL